jgi:hypothetical protein
VYTLTTQISTPNQYMDEEYFTYMLNTAAQDKCIRPKTTNKLHLQNNLLSRWTHSSLNQPNETSQESTFKHSEQEPTLCKPVFESTLLHIKKVTLSEMANNLFKKYHIYS